MEQALLQLRDILLKPRPTTGRVQSKQGATVRVSTKQGTVQAQLSENVFVAIGDQVRLEGDVIIQKLRPPGSIPTFVV